MPQFEDLSNELILLIADATEYPDFPPAFERAVSKLSLINKRFHKLLDPYLYRRQCVSFNRGESILVWAAKNGRIDTAAKAIAAGAPVRVPSSVRRSIPSHDQLACPPLALAARAGHADMVQFLLSEGADPNDADGEGVSVLCHAANTCQTDIVRLLLLAGADPAAAGDGGYAPISHAARAAADSSEIVEMLLADDRVDVAARVDDFGWSPLHWAASESNVGALRVLLLDGRHDPNAANEEGNTPLHLAVSARGKNTGTMGVVVRNHHVKCCVRDDNSRAARGPAALADNAACVKLLLDAGADPNAAGEDGRTPLSFAAGAADGDKVEIVEMLLSDERVDLFTRDDNSFTALYWAASENNPRTMKLLLDRGLDAQDGGAVNELLLHSAVTSSAESVAEVLLVPGVDPNALDIKRCTPLIHAVKSSAEKSGKEKRMVVDIVRVLVSDSRVLLNSTSPDGKTALAHAAVLNNVDCVKVLLATPGLDPIFPDQQHRSPLFNAVVKNAPDAVRVLASNSRVLLNAVDSSGKSALAYAAAKGYEDCVQALLEQDAVDVNLENADDSGSTALLYAITEGDKCKVAEMILKDTRLDVDRGVYDLALLYTARRRWSYLVQMLVEDGRFSATGKDMNGRTAMSHAAAMGEEGIVKILLGMKPKNGVLIDWNEPSNRGVRPSEYAKHAGHSNILQLLTGALPKPEDVV